MARLRDPNEQPINLFPMIDILTGTIGCFVFFVSVVSIFSLGSGKNVSVNVQKPIEGKHTKTPVFIEWDGSWITMHPGKNRIPLSVADSSREPEQILPGVPRAPEEIESRLPESITASRSSDAGLSLEENITRQIKNTSLGNLLRGIRRDSEHKYIIVMVRPSGFDTFIILRNFLLNTGIDVGYEPIDQIWNVEVK